MTKLPAEHPLNDHISGAKFAALCEGSWADDKRNGRDRPPASGLLYLKTENVLPFFSLLDRTDPDEQYVVVSTNSDLAVTVDGDWCSIYHFRRGNDGAMRPIPRQVKHWFACNLTSMPTDRVTPIPLGLANVEWNSGAANEWKSAASRPRKMQNRALCCFSIPTNPAVRKPCWDYFATKPWATMAGGKTELDLPMQDFAEMVRNHPFVICPDGNGPDSHRFWETAYLGSCPVVLAPMPCVWLSDSDVPLNEGLSFAEAPDWGWVERMCETVDEEMSVYEADCLRFSFWSAQICAAVEAM